jgi:plasmid stabilization system protein ParE
VVDRTRIEFAHSAQHDLLDLMARYSSQQAPDVGKRLVAAIIGRVEQLAMFSGSGRVVPEFGTPWLCELEEPPFRIVYRRDQAVVTALRVWRSHPTEVRWHSSSPSRPV